MMDNSIATRTPDWLCPVVTEKKNTAFCSNIIWERRACSASKQVSHYQNFNTEVDVCVSPSRPASRLASILQRCNTTKSHRSSGMQQKSTSRIARPLIWRASALQGEYHTQPSRSVQLTPKEVLAAKMMGNAIATRTRDWLCKVHLHHPVRRNPQRRTMRLKKRLTMREKLITNEACLLA